MSLECLSCGGELRRNLSYTTEDIYRCMNKECGRLERGPKGYYKDIDPDYDSRAGPILCACGCGTEIAAQPSTGRRRKWLNDTHRKRAERRAVG